MKRLIENNLVEWKNREKKMPLLIFGARQTGKTTTIYEFGKTYYSNIAVFNFEAGEKLSTIFDDDLNPSRIVNELEIFSGQSINQSTLIFLMRFNTAPRLLHRLSIFRNKRRAIAL